MLSQVTARTLFTANLPVAKRDSHQAASSCAAWQENAGQRECFTHAARRQDQFQHHISSNSQRVPVKTPWHTSMSAQETSQTGVARVTSVATGSLFMCGQAVHPVGVAASYLPTHRHCLSSLYIYIETTYSGTNSMSNNYITRFAQTLHVPLASRKHGECDASTSLMRSCCSPSRAVSAPSWQGERHDKSWIRLTRMPHLSHRNACPFTIVFASTQCPMSTELAVQLRQDKTQRSGVALKRICSRQLASTVEDKATSLGTHKRCVW